MLAKDGLSVNNQHPGAILVTCVGAGVVNVYLHLATVDGCAGCVGMGAGQQGGPRKTRSGWSAVARQICIQIGGHGTTQTWIAAVGELVSDIRGIGMCLALCLRLRFRPGSQFTATLAVEGFQATDGLAVCADFGAALLPQAAMARSAQQPLAMVGLKQQCAGHIRGLHATAVPFVQLPVKARQLVTSADLPMHFRQGATALEAGLGRSALGWQAGWRWLVVNRSGNRFAGTAAEEGHRNRCRQ